MNVVKKTGFLMVASCVLTACSSYYASNAETTYLKSKNGPNLVVPAPMTSANLGYFYNLPAQPQNARVNIKPPTF